MRSTLSSSCRLSLDSNWVITIGKPILMPDTSRSRESDTMESESADLRQGRVGVVCFHCWAWDPACVDRGVFPTGATVIGHRI